jgi:hypothetical protein
MPYIASSGPTSNGVKLLDYFSEVVIVDSEFRPDGRGGQEVRCIVAKELRSQNVHRVWIDGPMVCPYPVGTDALFVAHHASAELLASGARLAVSCACTGFLH